MQPGHPDIRLEGTRFEALQSVPIELAGAWIAGARRDWQGQARSSVPLVGIAFLESAGRCQWRKCEKREGPPDVRLMLLHYDEAGMNVRVSFSVGGGERNWQTVVPSASYRPRLPDIQTLQSACIHRFAAIDGEPPVDLSILFLARADVESLRNGLWRVRKRLAPAVPEPYRRWLTYGRGGTCE